jgi:putative flippase GtrA
MPDLHGQVVRFLLLGACNTALTTALLALLATAVDPQLAYTIVFVLGVLFTVTLTGRMVFRTSPSRPRVAMFAGWYLLVYAVGLLVVRLLDHELSWGPVALAIGTVAVTAPLSFMGGRLIFHTSSTRRPSGVPT